MAQRLWRGNVRWSSVGPESYVTSSPATTCEALSELSRRGRARESALSMNASVNMIRCPAVVLALFVLGASVLRLDHVAGQSFEGSTGSTAGGLLLGAYSGSVLGLLGTMIPCNQTLQGGKCAASGASAGGAVALAMGGLVGAQNPTDLNGRLTSAGIGTLVGAAVGAGLRYGVRKYDWTDVAAVAAIGGAVGAAPRGSGIGAGIGLATGGAYWLVMPNGGLDDFVMFTLAGLAVGGIYDWALGAANANRLMEATFSPAFSIPIR